jgi:glycosyltransferase involved in cell wall biosynthesis/uncharacterized SAM-binding protein YcdF (DUF218 family)
MNLEFNQVVTPDDRSAVPSESGGVTPMRNTQDPALNHIQGANPRSPAAQVAVLTAGRDKPYALGLAAALLAAQVRFEFIASRELDAPFLHGDPLVRVLNLRDQAAKVTFSGKILRVILYYLRLIVYALTAQPKLFHILWNNKWELFDRTVLMLWYRFCGRKLVITAHNVNAGDRDGGNSALNRWSLRVQYRLAHHAFVHTELMRNELRTGFGVDDAKISVIPFGLNSTVPNTALTRAEARVRLGLGNDDKVVLFFGNIAPYKGLEYLVEATSQVAASDASVRLVIAGRVKDCASYWEGVRAQIARPEIAAKVISRIEFIPDEETEVYFKAADVLALPYLHIFQSGVLFLAYNFGLPVIATDVGSLKEDVVEGETGFVCLPKDAKDLARAIRMYFASQLFRDLEQRRSKIKAFASERHSWEKVAAITTGVYSKLLRPVEERRACWGLLVHKPTWGLSWPGKLLALLAAMGIGTVVFFGIHPFLAVTERTNASVLVVEGWVHRFGARAAATEFATGSYERVLTTGGPVTGMGGYVNDQNTSASVGAGMLRNEGVAPEKVQMVPSRVDGRDRTYSSAIALADWLRQHAPELRHVNVVTEGAHGRRTRLLFRKALGPEFSVGIISVPSPDYEARQWWRYSEGVREVVGEAIAYLYARLFFHPTAAPDATTQHQATAQTGSILLNK